VGLNEMWWIMMVLEKCLANIKSSVSVSCVYCKNSLRWNEYGNKKGTYSIQVCSFIFLKFASYICPCSLLLNSKKSENSVMNAF
jgi:hypothetical protein